jgi:thiol-disulfide isomerase/thioredoxin
MRTRTTRIRAVIAIACTISGVGCSTVPQTRLSATDTGARTITQIGDRPVRVVSGEPGDSDSRRVSDLTEETDLDREIAGRVVDDAGQPIPYAEVRVAIDGQSGGRVVRVAADEAGRFTLGRLRAGSTYTLIGESRDETGALLTGRERVEAPSRTVEIALGPEGVAPEPGTRRSVAAARPIVSEADDAGDDLEPPAVVEPRRVSQVNDEDLPMPARAEEILASEDGASGEGGNRAWRRGGMGLVLAPSEGDDPADSVNPLPPAREDRIPTTVEPLPAESAPPPSRSAASSVPVSQPQAYDAVSDGPSIAPRPAAAPGGPESSAELIERALRGSASPTVGAAAGAPVSEAPVSPPVTDPQREPAAAVNESFQPSPAPIDPAPVASQDLPPAAGPEASAPVATPVVEDPGHDDSSLPTIAPPASESALTEPPAAAGVPPAAPQTDPNLPAPPSGPEPTPAPTPIPEPLPAEPPAAEPTSSDPAPAAPTTAAVEDSPPPVRRWTWAEIDAQGPATMPAVAADESIPPEVAAALADSSPTTAVPEARSTTSRPVDRSVVQASCRYDSQQKRLVDYRLVDLKGRPSRFRELDADYVLLDFWGTWCGPCLKTIPHLIELQERFPAAKFRVVGIAYEQGAISDRVAAVSAVSRRLGINYDLLIGEADGAPCPLREAFQVKAFPTLILLDRMGRVVWRDQGLTPMTLTRLDRVLTTKLGSDDVPGPVARR